MTGSLVDGSCVPCSLLRGDGSPLHLGASCSMVSPEGRGKVLVWVNLAQAKYGNAPDSQLDA